MDATPHTTGVKMVHGWNIHVEQYRDAAAQFRATATNIGGMFHYEWATGLDAAMALTNLAHKIGVNPADVLREFGL